MLEENWEDNKMAIYEIFSGTGGGQIKLKYTNLSEGKGKKG